MNPRNSKKERNPVYLNKDIPIEKRVEDLLKRMTIAEKVYQMVSIGNWLAYRSDEAVFITKEGPLEYRRMEWSRLISILKKAKFSSKRAKKSLGNGVGQLSRGITHFTPKIGTNKTRNTHNYT
jgi:hypothetical protein